MFYFIVFGIIGLLLTIRQTKRTKHYFIIVKNGQGNIEWVIRFIHYLNFLEGKPIKITAIDFGSDDDTINILERLTYKTQKVNRFYTADVITLTQIISLIEESRQSGERVIVQYVNITDGNLKVNRNSL